MRLLTKVMLWTALVSLLLVVNFALGMLALKELQTTNRITEQHYEISHSVRVLRSSLFALEVSGLRMASGPDSDGASDFARSRHDLETAIRSELNPEVVERELIGRYEAVRERIRRLLPQGMAAATFFTDQGNLNEREQINAQLRELASYSDDLVKADREVNERLFRRIYPLIWAVFLASLLAVVLRFIHFRKEVLKPIQALIGLIEQFRAGNLTARWELERPDELGDAGRTLNRLLAELSERRRERINFIGAVAHDIKNPLAAIEMSCDLILRNRVPLSESQTQAIAERIKGQVARLTRLTDDLLLAAKDNRPIWQKRPTAFKLDGLVATHVELARCSDSKHDYRIVAEAELPEVVADPERIAQVLTNLISNAAKYSPPTTTVEIAYGKTAQVVWLEIRDRGVGIPGEKKAAIFQPFSRLESGQKMAAGTGLGLAIVKDIVEAHSGRIRVLDRNGGGTVFRVELPRAVTQKNTAA